MILIKTTCKRKVSSISKIVLVLLLACIPLQRSFANTIVRVTTPLGEYFLELFDQVAPGTVSNFLSYVNSGRYNGTVIHRSEPGFVIQGGWVTFDEAANNFVIIETGPNIVNEFNVSNTRGTIAMAKVDGNPDSANSQWFINLADNTFLDSSNGGFTVFGRVLDNGMEVVDGIQALQRWLIVNSPFPTINYDGNSLRNSHLVSVTMAVAGDTSEPANYFDEATSSLHIKVNAGPLGLASATFSLVTMQPATVIKLDSTALQTLDGTVAGMASFNPANGILVLPELFISGAVAFRNVTFRLTDEAQLLFTLESFQ
ncbi:MAG: peptidylprolyl isomerase [Pseudohongiellaceae bacterium]